MTMRASGGIAASTNSVPVSVSPTGSPHTWTNNTGKNVVLIISGGTVSLIEHSYNGTNWLTTGLLTGMIFLRVGDRARITYAVAPTINYISL